MAGYLQEERYSIGENDYTEHVLNEEGEENGGIPMPVEDGFTYGSY